MSFMLRLSVATSAFAVSSFVCAQVQAKPVVEVFSTAITEAEITQTERGWCAAVIANSCKSFAQVHSTQLKWKEIREQSYDDKKGYNPNYI